jgi:hypothetical protein
MNKPDAPNLVEGRKIRAQTIHYTAISSRLSTAELEEGRADDAKVRRAEHGG